MIWGTSACAEEQQIKDDWFPIDGHWRPGGSDQFAEFMVVQLPN